MLRARTKNVHAKPHKPLKPRPEPINTYVENDWPRAKTSGRKEPVRSNTVWTPGVQDRCICRQSYTCWSLPLDMVDGNRIIFGPSQTFFLHCHQPLIWLYQVFPFNFPLIFLPFCLYFPPSCLEIPLLSLFLIKIELFSILLSTFTLWETLNKIGRRIMFALIEAVGKIRNSNIEEATEGRIKEASF